MPSTWTDYFFVRDGILTRQVMHCEQCGWQGTVDDVRGGAPQGVLVNPRCPACDAGGGQLTSVHVSRPVD
jgi:hypothetical protein